MGLTFLRDNGAHRAGRGDGMSDLFGDLKQDQEDEIEAQNSVKLDFEICSTHWRPISIGTALPPMELRPTRFVDGKDVGQTAAWMTSPGGRPVPIRVAQIGAVTLRAVPGEEGICLRTELRQVHKVVAFMADLFPWDEVESFTAALQAHGFRVLHVTTKIKNPKDAIEKPEDAFNYGRLRDSAKSATINAMFSIERFALGVAVSIPTLIDGSLQTKSGVFEETHPVTGLIKKHMEIPLHAQGFRTLQALAPLQRTPVYERIVKPEGQNAQHYLTWFLRLGPLGGETPDSGAVRVEINRRFFLETMSGNIDYVNQLSFFLCRCRTRDEGYSRAAITIYPIQRAEDVLRSQFAAQDTVANRFFRLVNL